MIGIIYTDIIVIRADRRGRGKQFQFDNREWATAIKYVNNDSFILPLFLIIQGKNHLVFWYVGIDLPSSWVVKTSLNGWTDNNIAID
jgi:hypothetical protein